MGGGNNNLMPDNVMPGMAEIVPISDERWVSMAQVPQLIDFTPPAAIVAGGVGIVTVVQGYRNFVCTHIGGTGPPVGIPAGPSRWKIAVRDIGGSRNWQPHRWDLTAVIGGNSGVSDSAPFELPVPWLFAEKTSIEVTFENISVHPAIPTVVLIGYLDVEGQFRALMQDLQRRQAAIQTY